MRPTLRQIEYFVAVADHRAFGVFVVRRIEHPEAVHEIVLHWRRGSPVRDDFERLASDLVAVKEAIRARRGERLC